MLTQYERFSNNGLELIIDTNTGECFASQRALARMVDKDESTIRYWLKQYAGNETQKKAQIPTPGGLQGARILNEAIIFDAFLKYKPELLVTFAKAGIRLYLHKLAGYSFVKQAPKETVKELTPSEKIQLTNNVIDTISKAQQTLGHQPRLAQLITDFTANILVESMSLPAQEQAPKLRGVVEIAEDMGFKTDLSSRTSLGKVVASKLGHLAQKEERLCNGMMRFINCYPDTPEVREAITQYFMVAS